MAPAFRLRALASIVYTLPRGHLRPAVMVTEASCPAPFGPERYSPERAGCLLPHNRGPPSGGPGQQSQDGFLRVVPGGEIAEVAVLAQLAERGSDRAAFLVPLDDARVAIGSPGHGRGIARTAGHLPDDPGDGALAASFTPGRGFRHGQAHGGQDGRMPGAEVLGGVLAPGYLAEVIG